MWNFPLASPWPSRYDQRFSHGSIPYLRTLLLRSAHGLEIHFESRSLWTFSCANILSGMRRDERLGPNWNAIKFMRYFKLKKKSFFYSKVPHIQRIWHHFWSFSDFKPQSNQWKTWHVKLKSSTESLERVRHKHSSSLQVFQPMSQCGSIWSQVVQSSGMPRRE